MVPTQKGHPAPWINPVALPLPPGSGPWPTQPLAQARGPYPASFASAYLEDKIGRRTSKK